MDENIYCIYFFWNKTANRDTCGCVWQSSSLLWQRWSGAWWCEQSRDVRTLHLTAWLPDEGGLWARMAAPSATDQYLLPVGGWCWCAGWRPYCEVLLQRVVDAAELGMGRWHDFPSCSHQTEARYPDPVRTNWDRNNGCKFSTGGRGMNSMGYHMLHPHTYICYCLCDKKWKRWDIELMLLF